MPIKSWVVRYNLFDQHSREVIFKVTATRNIRISIKLNLQITVTFSQYCSLKKAQEFFESKIIWVQNSLQKLHKRQEIRNLNNQVILPKFTSGEFLAKNHYLILRCRQLAEIHHFLVGKIILRRQKTIWGSCSFNNDISLNSKLAFLSNDLIDYVILHELVHTEIKNHSKKFWAKLEKVLPGCKTLDRQLKKFQPSFMVA